MLLKRKSESSLLTSQNPLFHSLKELPETTIKPPQKSKPIFHFSKSYRKLPILPSKTSKQKSSLTSGIKYHNKEPATLTSEDLFEISSYMAPVLGICKGLQTTIPVTEAESVERPKVWLRRRVKRKAVSRIDDRRVEDKFCKNKNVITKMINKTFLKLKKQQELQDMKRRVQTQRDKRRGMGDVERKEWRHTGYAKLRHGSVYQIETKGLVRRDRMSTTPGVEIFDNQKIRIASTHVSKDNSPTKINRNIQSVLSFNPENLKSKLQNLKSLKTPQANPPHTSALKGKIIVKVKEKPSAPYNNNLTSPTSPLSTNTISSVKNSFIKTTMEKEDIKIFGPKVNSPTDSITFRKFNMTTNFKGELSHYKGSFEGNTGYSSMRGKKGELLNIEDKEAIVSSNGIASTESNYGLTKGKYQFGDTLKRKILGETGGKKSEKSEKIKKQAIINQMDFNFGSIPIEQTPAMKIEMDELKEKIMEDNPKPPPFKI